MINEESVTKKRKHLGKVITFVVLISILIFLYYPIDLDSTMGIKGLTANNVSSISLHMHMPSAASQVEMEAEEIRLEKLMYFVRWEID